MRVMLTNHRDWQFIADRLDMTGSCWEWQGAKHERGYGRFNVVINGRPKQFSSHRAAYEIHYGVSPGDLEVMHSCDNPSCCNPDHLSLGSHQDNMDDMKRKGRALGLAGSENHKAKLTEQDVRDIRSLYGGVHGECAALARQYGVSKASMSGIVNGKTWKHVTI